MPIGRKLHWCGWIFDTETQTFDYPTIGYPIELHRLSTSAAILDFIIQISHKTWCSDECLSGFIQCMDDIICIQSNRCSNGVEQS